MYEKYSAVRPGASGSGGEYVPQTGFGWTNGVVLDLLAKFRTDTTGGGGGGGGGGELRF